MTLPGSYAAVLILLLFGMVGSGMWANMFQAARGKWRFELFCFDFAIGVVFAATVVALTAGSLGFDGFSFADELRLAGKRQDLFGFVAGSIFNLGNMLLLAAVSITGMAVAFPIGMGVALIVAAFWNFALNPGGSAAFLSIGAAVVLGAIALDILAFRTWSTGKLNALPEPVAGKRKQRKVSLKGLFLSLAGGLLLGSFSPLVQKGRAGENGLGPYSIGFIFAIGVLFSTFVFNLFFMNLPVQGEPVDIAVYFRARMRRHWLGLLGGILWYTGMIASLVAGRAAEPAQVGGPLGISEGGSNAFATPPHGLPLATVGFALAQASMVIAAVCGLFLWREFEGADGPMKIRLGLMLVLLVVGIGLSAAGLAPQQ